MARLKLLRSICLFGTVLLASCGGDGSGSTNGGGGVVPPVVLLPPPPVPPSAPASLVRVYAASSLIGQLSLQSPSIGGPNIVGYTSRKGEYFLGFQNGIIGGEGIGGGAEPNIDRSDWRKFFFGLDSETLVLFQLSGPATSKVVSPLTSLLASGIDDQSKLKAQFGITGSLFGLSIDPDLEKYDALKELESGEPTRVADGGRMAAANLRVLAVKKALVPAFLYTYPEEAARDSRMDTLGNLGACLNVQPPVFLFQNDRMATLINCNRTAGGTFSAIRPETVSAVAHLINAYAAAIPLRVETANERARWLLGINGYLVPAVALLVAADTDAAVNSALSVTTQDILAQTALYVDHYSFGPTDRFVAGPEFLTIASGATQTVNASLFRDNDREFEFPNATVPSGAVTSVMVPTAQNGQVGATLTGETVSVTVASGFRGATFFDYVIRNAAGVSRTGRVYVRSY